MKFNVETGLLLSAIKSCTRIVGASDAYLSFDLNTKKETYRLSASVKGTDVAFTLPLSVVSKSKRENFTIDASVLVSALTGKKNVDIEVRTGSIEVSTGRYKASLATSDSAIDADETTEQQQQEEERKALKLDSTLIEYIRKILPAVELRSLLDSVPMPVSVRATSKGVTMCCYDSWHMSFTRTKKVTGDCEFTLPVASLSLLMREFSGGKPFDLSLSSSVLYAKNKTFELSMALPAGDERNVIPASDAFALADSTTDLNADTFTLHGSLAELITNFGSVAGKGDTVDFVVDRKSCTISVKTSTGSVQSQFKAESKKPLKFSTDIACFDDLLSKAGGSTGLEMSVVDGRKMYVKLGPVTHMIVLFDKEKSK
jgi:hypothetical protein